MMPRADKFDFHAVVSQHGCAETAVKSDFRRRGKFGGDFVLYEDHPERCHAQYTVLAQDVRSEPNMSWPELLGVGRVAENVSKQLMWCRVHLELGPSVEHMVAHSTMEELSYERWAPNATRDDEQLLRLTAAGDPIEVSWDATACPATDYNLIYGSLSSVASYALSGAVGTKGEGTNRFGYAPVDGAWLDGNHANAHNRPWRTYGRLSHMVEPTPAGLFILLDENFLSLNDGNFSNSMAAGAKARWVDYVGTQHEFGAGLAFADGHT